MPIANYTSDTPAQRSRDEIQRMLVEAGARRITVEYAAKDHTPTAISFWLETPFGEREFLLPANVPKVLAKLQQERADQQQRHKEVTVIATPEQAERTAWRTVRDWLRAQLAVVQTSQVEAAEVMSPYLIVDDAGNTLYQMLRDKGDKLLPPPDR